MCQTKIVFTLSLIDKIEVPSYMPSEERKKFAKWQEMQRVYADAALSIHEYKIRKSIQLRKVVLKK
jgi:hypothetical protein